MQALVDANGAILHCHRQLPKAIVECAIAAGDAYLADDDCLVHKDAVKIGDGDYRMPE
jgi:hypothetical protein